MDEIDQILAGHTLPSKLTQESLEGGLAVLDSMLELEGARGGLSVEFLRQARAQAERVLRSGYNMAKAGVLVPVGVFGFTEGVAVPDLDISILGVGNHRFFLFHSALGLVVLRWLYRWWIEKDKHPDAWLSRFKRKAVGTLLGTYALGVGVHLAIDVFQPKAVIFPVFGSLVDGTLADDNIWLLGNSLWAFRVAQDVFVIALAEEIDSAKAFVRERFGSLPGDLCDRLNGENHR